MGTGRQGLAILAEAEKYHQASVGAGRARRRRHPTGKRA